MCWELTAARMPSRCQVLEHKAGKHVATGDGGEVRGEVTASKLLMVYRKRVCLFKVNQAQVKVRISHNVPEQVIKFILKHKLLKSDMYLGTQVTAFL